MSHRVRIEERLQNGAPNETRYPMDKKHQDMASQGPEPIRNFDIKHTSGFEYSVHLDKEPRQVFLFHVFKPLKQGDIESAGSGNGRPGVTNRNISEGSPRLSARIFEI
jgi:hypothetical protein